MTTLAAPDFFMRLLDPERDGPHLHAIFGDEDSCRYMSHPPLASASDTVALLIEWTKTCPDTSWAVADTLDGPALGRISIYPRGKNNVWDIACMIAPSARGRGIARRASAMAIDHVFEHKGARRIVADIDPDNIPSIRTFEKLGFTREAYLRAEWEMHIGIRDSVIFGLLKGDPRPWPQPGQT
jgi:[ribosomal protein S5]-alanine N-acetyltransferase